MIAFPILLIALIWEFPLRMTSSAREKQKRNCFSLAGDVRVFPEER